MKEPCPNVGIQYNCFMGETDQMNKNVGAYQIAIRGTKWWWPILTWLWDVAINNSLALIRSTGSNITQLEFPRQIAQSYLTRWEKPKGPGRRRMPMLGDNVLCSPRYNKTANFVGTVPNGKGVGALETTATAWCAHRALNVPSACAFRASYHITRTKCPTNP